MESRGKIALGLVIVFLLAAFNLASAQQSPSALRIAASTKAELSQMDWILLRAQVDNLAEFSSSSPVSLHHLSYDAASDRIVVTAVANPDWLASAKAET